MNKREKKNNERDYKFFLTKPALLFINRRAIRAQLVHQKMKRIKEINSVFFFHLLLFRGRVCALGFA